jgi:1,2-diacylglycerol 3-alpha-glucosyltransferase
LIFYTEDILGTVSSKFMNRIFWKYEPLLYNRYDLRTVPTASKKRFIMNQGMKNPIYTISNGIEDFYFQQAHPQNVREKYHLEDKKILLYASRLAPEKNQDKIVEAFKVIHERVPESHLILVGQGPMDPILRHQIKELQIEDAVTMTGFVTNEEIIDYYAAADITTLWSVVEAQGLVLLEAMAQGTPSVALNAMGIKDVVVDNKTGFLVNNLTEFVERTVQLLQNDRLHDIFSQNCLKYVEMHRMENIAKTWVKIYELLIDNYPMICARTPIEEQIKVYQDFVRDNEYVQY